MTLAPRESVRIEKPGKEDVARGADSLDFRFFLKIHCDLPTDASLTTKSGPNASTYREPKIFDKRFSLVRKYALLPFSSDVPFDFRTVLFMSHVSHASTNLSAFGRRQKYSSMPNLSRDQFVLILSPGRNRSYTNCHLDVRHIAIAWTTIIDISWQPS